MATRRKKLPRDNPVTDDQKSEAEELVSELDNTIMEAENVEFPGMYG